MRRNNLLIVTAVITGLLVVAAVSAQLADTSLRCDLPSGPVHCEDVSLEDGVLSVLLAKTAPATDMRIVVENSACGRVAIDVNEADDTIHARIPCTREGGAEGDLTVLYTADGTRGVQSGTIARG